MGWAWGIIAALLLLRCKMGIKIRKQKLLTRDCLIFRYESETKSTTDWNWNFLSQLKYCFFSSQFLTSVYAFCSVASATMRVCLCLLWSSFIIPAQREYKRLACGRLELLPHCLRVQMIPTQAHVCPPSFSLYCPSAAQRIYYTVIDRKEWNTESINKWR